MTLAEYGIPIGTLVYAEFANANNEWPTDLAKRTAKSDSGVTPAAKKNKIRTTGLHNLGNTCYMNSALQVIANLQVFHEYFVTKQQHTKQMNLKNPDGYKGELVTSFAQLINAMYNDKDEIVIPREFKRIVAKCSEQFSGFDQQDSQEYLSFLVDGLHEELNLRTRKPYLANPDSKNRDLGELSLEMWSNSLQRDWSLLYFTFYGQMRSQLTCKNCKNESTTFDMFSHMPVSLPEPTQQTLSIIVYRIQNKLKDILNNRTVRDEAGNITLQGMQTDNNTERDSESCMSSVYPHG